jgi:hypothetical protein
MTSGTEFPEEEISAQLPLFVLQASSLSNCKANLLSVSVDRQESSLWKVNPSRGGPRKEQKLESSRMRIAPNQGISVRYRS